MCSEVAQTFKKTFSDLSDPRSGRNRTYPMEEILFVVLCGSICGAESWRDFVGYGNAKIDFLRQYFPFEAGIPSKNTFARLFSVMNPQAFKNCFIEWVKALQPLLSGVVAIDGKTLCNSADVKEGTSAIHMVTAFATDTRLVLAQQRVAEKSNEITAIPCLLDLLDVAGSIVTIDAMGCQKAITAKLQEKGADYVIALKGNQGALHEDVRLFLETEFELKAPSVNLNRWEDVDKGHGRIENRCCVTSNKIDWLEQKAQWAGMCSVAMIEETREINGKISVDRRFFISSLPPDAEQIAKAIRAHWQVENSLHWTLDVIFNEDQSSVRKDHAPENMATVRHMALNMLNTAKKHFKGVSLKALRKTAGWEDASLQRILQNSF